MRASDLNRLRKLRFGQAVLLGVVIERRSRYGGGVDDVRAMRWYRTMPNTYKGGGYINGPFMTRHEAVDTALRLLGVITAEQMHPPGMGLVSGDDAPLPDAPKGSNRAARNAAQGLRSPPR